MSLLMIGDDVAVIPIEDPVRTKSGLYLHHSAKQRVDHGIVKYKGPAVIDVVVGDHVMFSGYSGTKLSIEGEGILYIMPENEVYAIIIDDSAEVMFPKTIVDSLLDEALGVIIQTFPALPLRDVNYILELVRTKFDDYVREKGLEF